MTPFGKKMRLERLERGMLLGDMARELGVSSPYLSQVETGKKPLNGGFVDKVIRFFDLNSTDANAFRRAAEHSKAVTKGTKFSIEVPTSATEFDRELAARLSLGFARMTPDAKRELNKLLTGADNGL
jgi:transcriptional regulator with XRE-family HTH domain